MTLLALIGSSVACVPLRPTEEIRFETAPESYLPVRGQWVFVERWEPPAPATDGSAGFPSSIEARSVPVVLVHGFGSSSYSWRRIAPPLAEAGYPVIAPDLYGFGWSERPREPSSYTPELQAQLVVDLLDRLGLDRVHLVGHSFGGGVALTLARDHPQRLESLALIDTTLPHYSRAPRSGGPLYRPLAYTFLRLVGLSRPFIAAALRHAVADDELVDRTMVDAYRDRLLVKGPAGSWRSVTAPIPRTLLQVDLETIDLPTLLVWGEEDRLIPRRAGDRAAEELPDARMVVFEEVGHLPMEEAPEELTRTLLGFWQELRVRDGEAGPPEVPGT